MYAVASLIKRGVYTVSGPFHPFGGAVDIIVVEQPDGSFKSSPWYVRFGKFQGVLKTREKIVNINVNGVDSDFHMYLDHKGEAYFLCDVVGEEGDLIFSPPSSGEETDDQLQRETSIESESSNFDSNQKNLSDQKDKEVCKIVPRTNSRRSRIFGLVFGRKSMEQESGSGDGNVERLDSLDRAEIAADLLEVKWSTNLSTDEVSNPNFNCLETKEKDLDVSVMEASNVLDRGKTANPSYASVQSADDITKMVSMSGSTIIDLQNAKLTEIEVKPSFQSVIEQVSIESNGLLGDGLTEDESQKERVSSCTFCETPESLPVGVDDSVEEKTHVHTGVYYETMELYSELSSRPELGALFINGNTIHALGSGNIPKTEVISGKNGTSMDSNAESIEMESHSFVNMHMITSDSVEAESMQVIELKTIKETLNDEKKSESGLDEEFDNQFRTPKFSYSSSSCSNESRVQEPPAAPLSQAEFGSLDQIHGLARDKESPVICTSSSLSNFIHHDQEEIFGEENKMNRLSSQKSIIYPRGSDIDYLPPEITNSSIPQSDGSDEEQFLFSDIDQLESSPVQCKESVSSNFMGAENHPLASTDDFLNEQDSSSFSDKLVHEHPITTSHAVLEESMSGSSPLAIPSVRKGPSEEIEWMMESLPNFRSHIDNLEIPDVLHPISCSLDSGSKSLRWDLFGKNDANHFKSNLDSDNVFLKKQHRISDTCDPEELKRMSSIPEIEISMCKNLLYEGMGVDAASQVFDAEKVDPGNFVSGASAPLKSDKLVVRIGGRYFPWDAAIPVISEMASIGHELHFEPEGMIGVERIEEALEGHSPRSIVSSGGSWRLWPFSFRRSKTMGSVGPGMDVIRGSDADNASESSNYLSPDKHVDQIKITVKKVKSIVPTSEQLASLNLKEGQNVIKFTFSTAMLGKQQVDARIFLWKWNTRIVVSDVDGTITRSDVLGQFMPLVGKDWSQSGVAHLFSAIEENGYKFMYLSARSVSQAYLTRQFLINLKQDGKALPDGPVVISPDGLFPSLYREVIRRAPHEFKIGCLEDIKALFPPDCHPFYAGFGNRDTDELSYLKVGIPKGKIFTINPKGEVAVHRRVDTKSYTSLHALVNGMFPAMTSAGQEEFNSWNFWKVPLPLLDI